MEPQKLLSILSIVDRYPISVIIAKQLMVEGIATEEQLREVMNIHPDLRHKSTPIRVNLENAFRDILSGYYDIKKVPSFFSK